MKVSISIEDCGSKDFKISQIDPSISPKAVVTHYLHNLDSESEFSYRQEAQKIIKDLAEYYSVREGQEISENTVIDSLLAEMKAVPFPTSNDADFRFIDLFAGIGGFRLAMQNLGGRCVFTSEWNVDAQKTYRANYGEYPFGDITQEAVKTFIPEKFDVLCAGFPCQAFSIAGYRKGFSDTRGTLFFDIEQIISQHRPKAVFLENVKNLVSHDKGNTFKIILDTLENKLGYSVYYKVLNSMLYADIPQNRERIFIIAFDPKQVTNHADFTFPDEIPLKKNIHDILEQDQQVAAMYYADTHAYYPELSKVMVSRDTVYQWRRVYARENKSNVCPTLTANMGAGGHNVPLVKDLFGLRKLTPKECFAFQGYPMDTYVLPPLANSKLYMQAGNSVTTTLIQRIGQEIVKVIR